MKITRLRTRLLLGATAIGIVMAFTSMLAVSWLISGQFLNQSNALLGKASRIINDNLNDRKNNQLIASRQLATQKNLGSTIWYLAQLADVNREMLFSTYQQLVKDTYKIGRVAKLSRIAIYDAAGELVSFASFDNGNERVGFVEHVPAPVFQVARLKDGEELNRSNMQAMSSLANIGLAFAGELPQRESVHYAVVDGVLAIESHVPIMGEVFDPGTGKQKARQLGLVVMVQLLDQTFVDQLSRLTDIKINIFTPEGLGSGNLPAYRNPDWSGMQQAGDTAFNEIVVGGERFYQHLMPLYTDKHLVGTLAVLSSGEEVRKNTWEMIRILGLIAFAALLFVLPFAWYLANSISRPLTVLSGIFRGVASGREALSYELGEMEKKRGDELGDLAQSFIAMNDAVKQKIQQINEINASLEGKIDQRTRELRLANNELTKLATHDVLTGLPNRQLVSDRLEQALVAARRDKARVALMFIDLDDFKPVNDTYGHAVGDLLLKAVAKRIHDCIRESDTVSRVGGDEFIVLLPVVEAVQDASGVAEKIRSALNQPFELADESLRISSSIGIAIYPEHGSDESALLKNADAAMYDAKKHGRNAVKLFS